MKKKANNSSQKMSIGVMTAKKKTPKGGETLAAPQQKNRFILVFLAAFLSVVIVAGIFLGVMLSIKNRDSYVEYGGVRVSSGVLNYLASYGKGVYLTNTGDEDAKDTPEFWASNKIGRTTYGEDMQEYVKNFIAEIVIAAYLFDSTSRLDKDAKAAIEEQAERRLLFIAEGGGVSRFNEITEPYGFDYSDFKDAMTLMFKAKMASSVLYGQNGADIAPTSAEAANYYANNYKRIKLLFIRTERDYVLDTATGERVKEENGKDMLITLNTDATAKREADIAAIKEAIENYNSGENGQMTPISFDTYLEKYKATNMYLDADGEYYSRDSLYTQYAASEYYEVVNQALTMAPGEFASVDVTFDDGSNGEDTSKGVCFIYCDTLVPGAYTDTESDYFSDFFLNLASSLTEVRIDELVSEVRFKDAYFDLDLIKLPANGIYTIGF